LLPEFRPCRVGHRFVAMYVVYLPMVFGLAKARNGFSWDARVIRHLAQPCRRRSSCSRSGRDGRLLMGAVVGLIATAVFFLHALGQLAHMTEIGGRSVDSQRSIEAA